MSEDRQDTLTIAPQNLGLLHPIGTPQVTPLHALSPGAQAPQGLWPIVSGAGQAIGEDVTNIARGIWEAGPGTLQKFWTGQLQPGTPEAAEAARQTAMTVGAMGSPIPRPAGSLGQFGTFHGTGASFDQFLDEFMGTGEGAQVYGWGHYVAQKPGVARTYMPEQIDWPTLNGQRWEHDSRLGADHPQNVANYHISNTGGDVDKAISNIQDQIDWSRSRSSAVEGGRLDAPNIARAQGAIDFLNKNRDNIGIEKAGGHLLNVWVKPEHEEFLDWDLPLHQQSPGVQEKLQSITTDQRILGRDIYNRMVDIQRNRSMKDFPIFGRAPSISMEEASRLASKQLDDIGIPGNRFLDQQSRHLPEDHPNRTYNYVVFDPKNLEITHRDGTPLTPVDHDPFAQQGSGG